MKGKPAGLIFLGVCVVLAGLLLAQIISILTASLIFAAALLVLGLWSRGFGR